MPASLVALPRLCPLPFLLQTTCAYQGWGKNWFQGREAEWSVMDTWSRESGGIQSPISHCCKLGICWSWRRSNLIPFHMETGRGHSTIMVESRVLCNWKSCLWGPSVSTQHLTQGPSLSSSTVYTSRMNRDVSALENKVTLTWVIRQVTVPDLSSIVTQVDPSVFPANLSILSGMRPPTPKVAPISICISRLVEFSIALRVTEPFTGSASQLRS